MRSSVGAVSLLALARLGVTHGDAPCLSLTSKIPDCALSCVKSAASAVGCTDPSDLSCQCEPASKEAILVTAQGCVMGCGMDQVLAAIDGGSAICDCVATATPPSVPVFTSAEPVYTTPPTLPSETSTPTQHTDSSAPPKETSKLPPYANTTAPTTQSFQPPAQSSAPPDSTQTQSTVRVVSSASPDRPPTSCLSEGSGESTATSEGPVTSSLVGGTTTAPCVPGSKSDCGAIATSAVPKCAQECFSSNVPKVGCDVTDYACQCQPAAQQSLSSFLVPCVATACPQAAIPSVIAGASQVCACATAPPSGGDCTATEGTDKTIVKTETLIATVTSCATGTQEPPKPTEGKPCLPGDDCGQHSTTTVVEPPASRPTESEKPGSEHSTGGHSVGPEPSCSTPGDVAPQPSCGNHSSCGGGGGGGGQQTGGHSEHPQPSASPTGGNPVVPKVTESCSTVPLPPCTGNPDCGRSEVPRPPQSTGPKGGNSGTPDVPKPTESRSAIPPPPCTGQPDCGHSEHPQPSGSPTGGNPVVPPPQTTESRSAVPPPPPCTGQPDCGGHSEHPQPSGSPTGGNPVVPPPQTTESHSAVPPPPCTGQPDCGHSEVPRPPPESTGPKGGNSDTPVVPQSTESRSEKPQPSCTGQPECSSEQPTVPATSAQPTTTSPPVAGSAGRFGTSLVAWALGVFWALGAVL